jgi:hypothetical protein
VQTQHHPRVPLPHHIAHLSRVGDFCYAIQTNDGSFYMFGPSWDVIPHVGQDIEELPLSMRKIGGES